MTALTVAGFDPSGGAGIIADLKTFFALGLQGTAVVTAVTVQNRYGVRDVVDIPPDKIEAQLLAVKEEGMPACLKAGMLATAGTVEVLAEFLRGISCPVFVIDPVLISSSGYALLKEPGLKLLKERLLPLATAVTPNIEEAEKLSGIKIDSSETLREAARRIHHQGAKAVVITGGDRTTAREESVLDLVFDGREFTEVVSERVRKVNLHGTGCIYSAALTVYLHSGRTIRQAAENAKRFVVACLEKRAGCRIPGPD